ncbi:glycosyltransferase family 2 protein [Elusimicrobiota bacterium]
MTGNKLTVVVIATNEEKDIGQCLRSVKPLGCRILVVDGGSTDSTIRIAEDLGAEIAHRKFDDFLSQRRYALDLVKTEWVLSLDADEHIDTELNAQILSSIEKNSKSGFWIRFEILFMGRKMRFCGLGKEKHMRLFRKDAIRLVQLKRVHEAYKVEGAKSLIKTGVIFHKPYENLSDYLTKCELYTDLAAEDFVKQGKKLNVRHHFIGPYEFFRRYLLQLGFLDAFPGFAWAALSAYHRTVRYSKIRRLLQNR